MAKRPKKSCVISIRATAAQRAQLDDTARSMGLTRTALLLKASIDRAKEVLAEQSPTEAAQ